MPQTRKTSVKTPGPPKTPHTHRSRVNSYTRSAYKKNTEYQEALKREALKQEYAKKLVEAKEMRERLKRDEDERVRILNAQVRKDLNKKKLAKTIKLMEDDRRYFKSYTHKLSPISESPKSGSPRS